MARVCSKDADQILLAALACGATVELAARMAGVSERTTYRRLDDENFVRKLQQRRAELVQRTAGMLTDAGLGSVKTLIDLQKDATVSAAVRRHAARDVLELGLKYRETAELEQRLATIEARLAASDARVADDLPADAAA